MCQILYVRVSTQEQKNVTSHTGCVPDTAVDYFSKKITVSHIPHGMCARYVISSDTTCMWLLSSHPTRDVCQIRRLRLLYTVYHRHIPHGMCARYTISFSYSHTICSHIPHGMCARYCPIPFGCTGVFWSHPTRDVCQIHYFFCLIFHCICVTSHTGCVPDTLKRDNVSKGVHMSHPTRDVCQIPLRQSRMFRKN